MISETEPTVGEGRWGVRWQNLQTFSFSIGWVVGVPAGALCAIAWALWTNQGTYAAMQRQYTEVAAMETADATRVTALEKVEESGSTERSSIRDRLTKLETQAGPRAITSELLDRYGAHISALDGRSDEMKRNLDEMRAALEAQITGLCVEVRGIAASSGKQKGRACP